jgi:hypothetical protein
MSQNLSRRAFLRGAVAAVAAPVVVATATKITLWDRVIQGFQRWANKRRQRRIKDAIISRALNTEAGRTALSQAMIEPIRTSLMYQGIGRKLLMVDELPSCAVPRYIRVPISALPRGLA